MHIQVSSFLLVTSNDSTRLFHVDQRHFNPYLVGGWPTPLKNMISSVGMIIYSQYMEK